MSPLREYLYLKPLYSCLGGSTTLADPLTKNPGNVLLRKYPLYNWNTRTHLILVLSVMYNQDSRININTFFRCGLN